MRFVAAASLLVVLLLLFGCSQQPPASPAQQPGQAAQQPPQAPPQSVQPPAQQPQPANVSPPTGNVVNNSPANATPVQPGQQPPALPNETAQVEEEEPIIAPIGVSLYKGFWMPCMFLENSCQSMSDVSRLKDVGANVVALGPTVKINAQGEVKMDVSMDVAEQRLAELAKYYYGQNISIAISIETMYVNSFNDQTPAGGPGAFPSSAVSKPGFLDKYNQLVEQFANLSEKYHVAIFSPMNEPDMKLGASKASEWGQQVLPLVKKYYSGKVLYKAGNLAASPQLDFRGYDIIGIDTTPGGGGPQGGLNAYPALLDKVLADSLAWAKRDGVPEVMFTEFGVWGAAVSWNENDKATAHELVFEAGKGKVTGFFVLDPPPDLDRPITGTKSLEVVKEWFTQGLD
ncbi:Uncharacterised protein [Candidatus Burarchaeum australiense]|nr:Uncharacterised protein [Candidatus Burarchaeum australiense]